MTDCKSQVKSLTRQTATANLIAREGVAHLYLLDFDGKDLLPFVERLRNTYPSTKV